MQIRSSAEEIDLAILDTAAGLFAVHGIERTSVQQIADAVGYSKTGLLHRFTSKQGIVDAVEAMIGDQIEALLLAMSATPQGPQRTGTLLREIAGAAHRVPGAVQYLLDIIKTLDHASSDRCGAAGLAGRVLEALLEQGSDSEAQLRLLLALHLVAAGAVLGAEQRFADLAPRLVPLLTELATAVADVTTPEGHF